MQKMAHALTHKQHTLMHVCFKGQTNRICTNTQKEKHIGACHMCSRRTHTYNNTHCIWYILNVALWSHSQKVKKKKRTRLKGLSNSHTGCELKYDLTAEWLGYRGGMNCHAACWHLNNSKWMDYTVYHSVFVSFCMCKQLFSFQGWCQWAEKLHEKPHK